MKSNNKFYLWPLLFMAGFVIAAWSQTSGQGVEGISKTALEAARQGLSSYVGNVINKDNFSKFGFKTLDEAKTARLGDPYQEAMIGLKDLKEYQPNTRMDALLTDTKTLWFPVLVDSVARTKMEVVSKDGKWITGEFGGTRSALEIVRAGRALPQLLESRNIQSPYDVRLVKIPVLYAVFLYVRSSMGEFIIPAMVQPERFGLQSANIYTVDEVFPGLADEARKIAEDSIR